MPRSTKPSHPNRAVDPLKNPAAAQNAGKADTRVKPLIPLQEDVESWLQILTRWYNSYLPDLASPHYQYVVSVAREDWLRNRAQNDYNLVLQSIGNFNPAEWTPAEIKRHDQALRLREQADLAFHRAIRLLRQFYKNHPPRVASRELPASRGGQIPAALQCQQVREEPLVGLALWQNTRLIN